MKVYELPIVSPELFAFQLEFQAADRVDGERHFVEHLLLNSNDLYTKDQLRTELGKLGGGLFDARTSNEHVMLSGTYLKRDEEAVWRLLKSVLNYASFLPEEIEKERKIIIEEYEQGRTMLFRQMYDSIGKALKRPMTVVGSPDEINSFTRDSLIGTYHDVISFRRAKLFLHNAEIPNLFNTVMDDQDGKPLVDPIVLSGDYALENEAMSSSVALVSYSRGFTPADLMLVRYLSDVNGPLFKRLREDRQLCYMVGAMTDLVGDSDLCDHFTLYAVSNAKIEEAAKGLEEEFLVSDPEVYDSLRRAYELEVATAKTGVFGPVGLVVRAEKFGIAVDDLVDAIPSWDDFKRFAEDKRSKRVASFVIQGAKNV